VKNLLLSVALALCAVGPASAQGSGQAFKDLYCDNLGVVAANIMDARQLGITITELLTTLNSMGVSQKDMDIYVAITLSAYRLPMYEGQSFQRLAVTEFRREIEALCQMSDI
jgi:hypothetical protein